MRRRWNRHMSTSQRAGLIAASASVPRSLVPLLHERSISDQGLITGMTAAMDFALTAAWHEAARGTARAFLGFAREQPDDEDVAWLAAFLEFLALVASSASYASLPYRERERIEKAALRTVARKVQMASAAGLAAEVLGEAPPRSGRASAVPRSGLAAAARGAGVAGAVHLTRAWRVREDAERLGRDRRPPLGRSVAAGALTAAGAAGLAAVERGVARGVGTLVSRASGSRVGGEVAGHLVSTALIAGAVVGVGTAFVRKAERAMSTPDPALDQPPDSAVVSGGEGSIVDWDPLTREVRRHLASVTPARRIEAIMGGEAIEPIRVFVGLTSADSIAERVGAAIVELERTGALERSLLVLCSPTGSGFINYAASAAWEYMSRGDCASVAIQYSSRPSWLSLDRVSEGRAQNRALWHALAEIIGTRPPERRPRVVMFGESLGAHTSQDAFLGQGTDGLHALGVDRALWLGVPYTSRWAIEVRDPDARHVAPGEVLRVASADELGRLDPEAAARARYVIVAHEDDAVTLFSPALLVEHPWWLGDERPAAVPPQATWASPTTFLQVAVDAKNAGTMTPGEFGTRGHDYRGECARAVRFAFGLPCEDAQLAAIEIALRDEEVARSEAWARE